MKLCELFSESPCNTGRQPELDLGKAIPILCLAFVHCIIECTSDEGLCSGIPYLFDTIIGGPLSAPMFMFAMGVGMVYTRHGSPGQLARRGVLLCVIAVLLNICRFLLPSLIGYALTGDYSHFISPLVYKLPENDILMFAGGAFLFMALCIRLGIPRLLILAVSAGLSVLATFLNGTDVHSIPGNIILGFFIGTEDPGELIRSYFPFCNWIIVPAAGYVFGSYLFRLRNKKKFYLMVSPLALIITAVYVFFGIRGEIGMFGEGQNCYYHITTPDVLISILAAVGMLGIYAAVAHYLPDAVMRFFSEVSRNINSIYCIHWIFVSMITGVLLYCINGTQELPLWQTLVLSAGIAAISVVIAHYYVIFKRRRKTAHEKEKNTHC